MTTIKNQPVDKQGNAFGILFRVFWMFLGNFFLLIAIILILENKGGIFHKADIVFWVVTAILILVRYLDISCCDGLTASGLPASIRHWTKYTMFLLIFSTILWIIAHVVNYLVVNK